MNKRYDTLKCLGSGPLGTVYKCQHLELSGQIVALKTFSPEMFERDNLSVVLSECIGQAYSIEHSNVVRVFEYINDGKVVAISMEYLEGGSLADELGQGYKFNLSRCTHLLSGILRGLEALHAAEIVVQNLKTENILLTSQGNPKISDYFFSKYFESLATQGAITGSIDYVTPEYISSGTVNKTTDIYGVGCLAYELITGQSPFFGESVAETMKKRMESNPISPSDFQPTCPKLLSDWTLKMLSNNSNDRFQSAAEALMALDESVINLKH